jgi:hypothetical protein
MWRSTLPIVSLSLIALSASANASILIGNTTDSTVLFVVGGMTSELQSHQISSFPCEGKTASFSIGTADKAPFETQLSCDLSYAIYFEFGNGSYSVMPYSFDSMQQQQQQEILKQQQQQELLKQQQIIQQQGFAPNVHELLKRGLPNLGF